MKLTRKSFLVLGLHERLLRRLVKPMSLKLDEDGLLRCKKLRTGMQRGNGRMEMMPMEELNVGVIVDVVIHSSPLMDDIVYEEEDE